MLRLLGRRLHVLQEVVGQLPGTCSTCRSCESILFFNFIFFSYPYCTFLVGVPRPLIVCVFVCAVDTMPPEGVRCGMEEKKEKKKTDACI